MKNQGRFLFSKLLSLKSTTMKWPSDFLKIQSSTPEPSILIESVFPFCDCVCDGLFKVCHVELSEQLADNLTISTNFDFLSDKPF